MSRKKGALRAASTCACPCRPAQRGQTEEGPTLPVKLSQPPPHTGVGTILHVPQLLQTDQSVSWYLLLNLPCQQSQGAPAGTGLAPTPPLVPRGEGGGAGPGRSLEQRVWWGGVGRGAHPGGEGRESLCGDFPG